MWFVLFSWSHKKRPANNISQERQYVELSFPLSVKEARGQRCEKYRFRKITDNTKNPPKIPRDLLDIIVSTNYVDIEEYYSQKFANVLFNYTFFEELEKISC